MGAVSAQDKLTRMHCIFDDEAFVSGLSLNEGGWSIFISDGLGVD